MPTCLMALPGPIVSFDCFSNMFNIGVSMLTGALGGGGGATFHLNADDATARRLQKIIVHSEGAHPNKIFVRPPPHRLGPALSMVIVLHLKYQKVLFISF